MPGVTIELAPLFRPPQPLADADGARGSSSNAPTQIGRKLRWTKWRCCACCCLLTAVMLTCVPLLSIQPPLPPDTSRVFGGWPTLVDGINVQCFRLPSIVQIGNGTLFAFAEARLSSCEDCTVTGIVYGQSVDGGRSWSSPKWVVPPDEAYVTAVNPTSLYDAQSGRILLQYVRGRRNLAGQQSCNPGLSNWQISSSDGGLSWSIPVDLSLQLGPWAGVLVGPGAGIQLSDAAGRFAGRHLWVGHYGAYMDVVVWYSDDGGMTYHLANTSRLYSGDESQLLEMPDGRVAVNMRNKASRNGCRCRAVAYSSDGGVTFTSPSYDAALISPVCQGSLSRIGDRIYFSNPHSTSHRANGRVQASDDGGRTWDTVMAVTDGGLHGSFGYSALVQGPLIKRTSDDKATSGGLLWEHSAVPLLSLFGPLFFDHPFIYFTRFDAF